MLSASLPYLLTVGFLWVIATYFLARMPKAEELHAVAITRDLPQQRHRRLALVRVFFGKNSHSGTAARTVREMLVNNDPWRARRSSDVSTLPT